MITSNTNLRILFVARNYPPIIGGLENNANDFYKHISEIATVDLLANRGGKKHLVPFFLKTCLHLMLNAHRFDIVHFNDAVLSPVLPIIRIFSKAKVTFTVNGLDVVFQNFFYQMLIPAFLRKADKLFPISQYTKEECEKRGVDPEKLEIITVGINLSGKQLYDNKIIDRFLQKFSIDTKNRILLVSIGRLVERKGHAWFLEEVFPQLQDKFIYIIAGDGPQREVLLKIIEGKAWSNRVYVIGRVSDEEKNLLYQIADIFIMPNISIRNDPEGFGIVLLEAGCYNVPVVATDIEGISSAVIDGVTGRLVQEGDIPGFLDAIQNLSINRSEIRPVVEEKFDWHKIANQYLAEFLRLKNK